MLLVITIIGILAALVIPKMVGRSEQARQAAAHADLSSASKPRSTRTRWTMVFIPRACRI